MPDQMIVRFSPDIGRQGHDDGGMNTFNLQPISAATAATLRRCDAVVIVANENPGFPCRQCLRDAAVGEELILVSYDPFDNDSPYRCTSPIFLHRDDCGSPVTSPIPEQLRRRQLSVRAFDANAIMTDAAVVDGESLEITIESMFRCPTTERLHVHNAGAGCWAITVVRAGPESASSPADAACC